METAREVTSRRDSNLVPTRWGNKLNGNLRDWVFMVVDGLIIFGPHSLGKSVEWKLISGQTGSICCPLRQVPTRWGNQLNGNNVKFSRQLVADILCPHSLGKSVEWKPDRSVPPPAYAFYVPTRWGNQLNGNVTANKAA